MHLLSEGAGSVGYQGDSGCHRDGWGCGSQRQSWRHLQRVSRLTSPGTTVHLKSHSLSSREEQSLQDSSKGEECQKSYWIQSLKCGLSSHLYIPSKSAISSHSLPNLIQDPKQIRQLLNDQTMISFWQVRSWGRHNCLILMSLSSELDHSNQKSENRIPKRCLKSEHNSEPSSIC